MTTPRTVVLLPDNSPIAVPIISLPYPVNEPDDGVTGYPIDYNGVSSQIVNTIAAGTTLKSLSLVVTEVFNGIGAAIEVVDNDETVLMASSELVLTETGINSTSPAIHYLASNAITVNLTVGSAATQGKAYLVVESFQ